MTYGDTPQQQLKRARLHHPDTGPSEHSSPERHATRPSAEQAQPVASGIRTDMASASSHGAALTPSGVHPGEQQIHWMPVFCQMGSPSSYEGHGPGGLGSWVQSMPMQMLAGGQGGLQPYPYMGPQPNIPAAAAAAAVTTGQSQPALEQSSPAISIADAAQSSAHDVARRGSQSAVQRQSQPGTAQPTKEDPSRSHKCVESAQGRAGEGGPTLGLAACLPKLGKQLSNRSCEDLTANAVAKLWGVNLRRYTGRSS